MPLAGFPRLCISSTRGGGGKTLTSLGIGRALSRRGLPVKPFKKGPDFIDAAWLSRACGAPATNLDPFFLTPAQCRALFAKAAAGAEAISLIEGNRGLYDGLDASGAVSTAALARTLNAPIILSIDCTKATRTVAALLSGLVFFEDGLNFAGVILNKTGSARHEALLRQAVEELTPLRVLGALPRLDKNPLPERHMGLASMGASLANNVDAALNNLAEFIEANVDLDAILDIARNAGPLPPDETPAQKPPRLFTIKSERQNEAQPRIGYVNDKALWFYYPENLQALEEAGASLAKLSILDLSRENAENWENLSGLYLGGGFPEDFAPRISQSPLLQKLRELAEAGLPIYAECGGLIILCESLEREGQKWPMAGIFRACAQWHVKPRGLGYIEARVIRENPYFPLGMEFRGHEFHYSDCVFPQGDPAFALAIDRGNGLLRRGAHAWDAMLHKNVWAAYTHIFAPALPCWARNFVAAARLFQTGQCG